MINQHKYIYTIHNSSALMCQRNLNNCTSVCHIKHHDHLRARRSWRLIYIFNRLFFCIKHIHVHSVLYANFLLTFWLLFVELACSPCTIEGGPPGTRVTPHHKTYPKVHTHTHKRARLHIIIGVRQKNTAPHRHRHARQPHLTHSQNIYY